MEGCERARASKGEVREGSGEKREKRGERRGKGRKSDPSLKVLDSTLRKKRTIFYQ